MSSLEVARSFGQEISARALETERARSVPEDLIRRLGALGIFRLFVPSELGGTPVTPMTGLEILEELARADGSTGWTAMILNTTFFASWLEPDVARGMLKADLELGMAGQFGPIGRIAPAGDRAVRLSGRWAFNSGSPHATWFCQGAFVPGESGPPQWGFLFVPAADVRILDTWHVAGLRGTASHDVEIQDALVPRERIAYPLSRPAPHEDPHFRWSFFSLLAAMISAFPLGVARRALDEFADLAKRKARGPGPPLAAEQAVQLEVARCEGGLRAARRGVLDALEGAWQTAVTGDPPTREQRLDIRLASGTAMRAGLDAVDTTFRLAGGGALYDASPLQRCWRDLHAGSQHVFFSNNQAVVAGQVLLGQPAQEWLI